MELLIVVVGIILLWKFASSLNGIAVSARAKTEVMSEKVIADAVIERTDNFEDFQKRMDGKKVYSHSEIMEHFKTDN